MKYTIKVILASAVTLYSNISYAIPCAIPNAIANGQPADASKVMDNFNAVAACAEGAVNTSGTVSVGSLAIISGTNAITSGNLTGDVTTLGGTVATLANSGVVPGTYSSANIIVDSKGRVTSATSGTGGGGNAWSFSPPSASSFTLASGDSTNLSLTDDVDAGLLIDGGAPVNGDVGRIAYQTVPNKSGQWQITAKMKLLVPSNNYSNLGLVMRDSIGGRMISFAISGDGSYNVHYWNGLVGWNSNPMSIIIRPSVEWFRISHSGNYYNFYFSSNGKLWKLVTSLLDTAWTVNKADQVGFMANYNRSSGMVNSMSVEYHELEY